IAYVHRVVTFAIMNDMVAEATTPAILRNNPARLSSDRAPIERNDALSNQPVSGNRTSLASLPAPSRTRPGLHHLHPAYVLKPLQIRPERPRSGEDQLQFLRLEVFRENVLVVGPSGAEGVDQQLGAFGLRFVLQSLDVGFGLAQNLDALGIELGYLKVDVGHA